MSEYRKWINALKFEGIQYDAFINDDGDMVVRIDYSDGDYHETIFNGVGKSIADIYVIDGEMFTFGEASIHA